MSQKAKLTDGISDLGVLLFRDYYSDGYPWQAGYGNQLSGCSVAQDGKDILLAGKLYTAAGMRLRDAIRHAEICGEEVPDGAYRTLDTLKRFASWYVEGAAVANVVQTTLLFAPGGFQCEYAGTGNSATGSQHWFKFTLRVDIARTLRPRIAFDEPRYPSRQPELES